MDTEFTSFHELQLLSIGMAASTGEEFYAEVNYSLDRCSEFVKDVVVPLLSGRRMTSYSDLHKELLSWFNAIRIEAPLFLCYDSDFDRKIFSDIFDGSPPVFIQLCEVGYRNISAVLRCKFHADNNLPAHHALNDARALRYAFREHLGRCM